MKKIESKKTIVVIGGGIHGMSAALALAQAGAAVVVLEKKSSIMAGTSGSTHNRAHMGYHYPRSIETAEECLRGLNFFKERFPQALSYPKEAYYLIEKRDSKVSAKEFERFCKKVKIPYTVVKRNDAAWNKEHIVCGFRVPEPIFDIKTLKRVLKAEAKKLGVEIVCNAEVHNCQVLVDKYQISAKQSSKTKRYLADAIVNATYAYTNNLLKILNLECDMTRYELQKTEVITAKSKKELPALTVSDGDFISIMPLAGTKKTYLIYDVKHSVVEKKEGFFLDASRDHPTNFDKMVEHGKKYFPFMDRLKFVKSNYGFRPIPPESVDACRKTRLIAHSKHAHIYSILEGKFISAPLIAEELVAIMRKNKSL